MAFGEYSADRLDLRQVSDLAFTFKPLQGVQFQVVQVDLSNKPGWYRSINPQTLVPSLVADGETVVESIDICR